MPIPSVTERIRRGVSSLILLLAGRRAEESPDVAAQDGVPAGDANDGSIRVNVQGATVLESIYGRAAGAWVALRAEVDTLDAVVAATVTALTSTVSALGLRVTTLDAAGTDGLQARRVARATFDPSALSGHRGIGAHGLGVTIPDKAHILRSWYVVKTTLVSATDAGTLALALPTDLAMVAAIAISNGANPWDAGASATGSGPDNADPSTFTQTTAAREITATVAVEALTAGKLVIFVEYVVGY